MPKGTYEFLTGKKYPGTRLTPLKWKYTEHGHKFFLCNCECGEEKVIMRSHIVRGHTRSCGCLQRENWDKITTIKSTHESRSKGGKWSEGDKIRIYKIENDHKNSPYELVTEEQLEDIWAGWLAVDWELPSGERLTKMEMNAY